MHRCWKGLMRRHVIKSDVPRMAIVLGGQENAFHFIFRPANRGNSFPVNHF
jgi:hypothetical protein